MRCDAAQLLRWQLVAFAAAHDGSNSSTQPGARPDLLIPLPCCPSTFPARPALSSTPLAPTPAGLEVKVAFGGVWKDSLSELSGGQKSLLALSLILAMLLFKPAPIYILDEVDAALDLSHTQNIGRMIKTHFPQSQVGSSGWGAVGWVWVGGGRSSG